MIKIILFFAYSLFIFSYNDFISDGNNSEYKHLKHIVNTSESKIYLAIGVEAGSDDEDLIKIDTSSANVVITKVEDITTIEISKMLALKDINGYTGQFILAGESVVAPINGRLEHFSYTSGAGYATLTDYTYPSIGNILDIVQNNTGDRYLYFVSTKNDIFHHELIVADTGIDYSVSKTIYEGYLDINGRALLRQSYLAEINKDDVADIKREFSYDLGGENDANATVAIVDTFFTLGFDSRQGTLEEPDITIIGSNPLNNLGTKLTALSVNTSILDTTTPTLLASKLIAPAYTLLENQAVGAVVTVGSTAIYGPEVNALNISEILGPGFTRISLPTDNASQVMERAGNISKLTTGFYNVTLGAPYDKVINWLDVDCADDGQKYLVPWNEAEISALTGTLTNQDGKTDYELCRTNDKFIYQTVDANLTRINRQWQFIFDDETPIRWMQDIPNDKIIGDPPLGRIETITTDNTSMAIITQGDGVLLGGIHLFRIIDSTSNPVADRIKWHKIYSEGGADNSSRVLLNGPNLLKTIANDFLVTGKSRDLTRTDGEREDCMVIKVDKNGNELWTKNLGGFHDDNCYSVALEKNNTSPFYNDYVAVGNSGTRNPDDATDRTSYGVKFRDEGTLIHLAEGWSLITNGTDRNITAQGKKEESNTMGVTHLGAYKSYFQFIKNQWLINKYPIEPLTGFWIYTIDGRHDIFLEGNLLEQTFSGYDLGWVLLGTGVKLTNTKRKFNLEALWKFKEQKWIENPTVIYPGEGFWAKKKR